MIAYFSQSSSCTSVTARCADSGTVGVRGSLGCRATRPSKPASPDLSQRAMGGKRKEYRLLQRKFVGIEPSNRHVRDCREGSRMKGAVQIGPHLRCVAILDFTMAAWRTISACVSSLFNNCLILVLGRNLDWWMELSSETQRRSYLRRAA